MTETFYDVLGVSSDATTGEIRAAYRERLKRSHPDLNDDEDATAATKRIIRARDVLTDDAERERYDRVGHDAFVGDADSSVDESDVDSAAAARRAGWQRDGSTGDETADRTSDDSSTAGPNRARERRRREREARERVDGDDARTTTDETRTEGTTSTEGATNTDGGSTATGDGAAGGISESARSWNGSGGYSVRQRYDSGPQRRRLFPTGQSLTLLAVAFVLYPVMLFSAVFPPFPLWVNLVVGLCTIFLVGYLQSVPEVGVLVFGVWSLAIPVAFVVTGVSLTGLVGIVALTATWLPLGLSVLTLTLVRP